MNRLMTMRWYGPRRKLSAEETAANAAAREAHFEADYLRIHPVTAEDRALIKKLIKDAGVRVEAGPGGGAVFVERGKRQLNAAVS